MTGFGRIENVGDVRTSESDLHNAWEDAVGSNRGPRDSGLGGSGGRNVELSQVGANHGQEGVANDYRVGDAQDFSSYGGTREELEINLATQTYSTRSMRSIPPGFTVPFHGGGHVDKVIGSSDGETLVGDEHDNIFIPGDGIDFVYGSGHFDENLGSYPYESSDTVSYEDSYAPTIYDGDFTGIEVHKNKAHHHTWGGTAQADHLFSIENFIGSSYGDVFINDYKGENNIFTGAAGEDVYALNSKGFGGADTWTDFSIGEDKIDVTDIKFDNHIEADLNSHDDARQALVSQGLIFTRENIQQTIDNAEAAYEANGNKLILDFGDLGTLTLEGIEPGQLTLNDFIFKLRGVQNLELVGVVDGDSISYAGQEEHIVIDLMYQKSEDKDGHEIDDFGGLGIKNAIGTDFDDTIYFNVDEANTVTGGDGSDTFAFHNNQLYGDYLSGLGHNTVTDFKLGEDVLDLRGLGLTETQTIDLWLGANQSEDGSVVIPIVQSNPHWNNRTKYSTGSVELEGISLYELRDYVSQNGPESVFLV